MKFFGKNSVAQLTALIEKIFNQTFNLSSFVLLSTYLDETEYFLTEFFSCNLFLKLSFIPCF